MKAQRPPAPGGFAAAHPRQKPDVWEEASCLASAMRATGYQNGLSLGDEAWHRVPGHVESFPMEGYARLLHLLKSLELRRFGF